MAAYQQAIAARIGEGWSATFEVDQPATWTGWTARAQIRYYRQAPTLLVELDVDLSVDGQVTVTLDGDDTAALAPLAGEWDLLVQPTGGDPQYIAEGPVTLTGRVTVPA
jgi:hypothetical protein